MDESGEHVSVGMGELDESAIATHPRLDRSAPPPWSEPDWPAIYERLDGESEPPSRPYEEIARHLSILLHWIASGDVPDPKPNLFRVSMRTAMLAEVLGVPLCPTVRRALAQARYRAKQRAKKGTA